MNYLYSFTFLIAGSFTANYFFISVGIVFGILESILQTIVIVSNLKYRSEATVIKTKENGVVSKISNMKWNTRNENETDEADRDNN